MTFKQYLQLREGGFINDARAEDGKSRLKTPANRMPQPSCGAAGGPGPCPRTGPAAPIPTK
jgi:hypothetical protein